MDSQPVYRFGRQEDCRSRAPNSCDGVVLDADLIEPNDLKARAEGSIDFGQEGPLSATKRGPNGKHPPIDSGRPLRDLDAKGAYLGCPWGPSNRRHRLSRGPTEADFATRPLRVYPADGEELSTVVEEVKKAAPAYGAGALPVPLDVGRRRPSFLEIDRSIDENEQGPLRSTVGRHRDFRLSEKASRHGGPNCDLRDRSPIFRPVLRPFRPSYRPSIGVSPPLQLDRRSKVSPDEHGPFAPSNLRRLTTNTTKIPTLRPKASPKKHPVCHHY